MRRSFPELLHLTRWLDVRPGEWAPAMRTFATLFLVVAGITCVEGARDAMLLSKLPPSALGAVYSLVAVLTVPAGIWAARTRERAGGNLRLAATLSLAAVAVLGFALLPPSATSVFALYVLSGLIGAVALPQFWAQAARRFTPAQGRRLLGPIAAAGTLGGIAGSGSAAAVLLAFPVTMVLGVAAGFFLLGMIAGSDKATHATPPAEPSAPMRASLAALRNDPFPRRIALLVVLSTATVLAVDFLFKSTVAASVPAEARASFFARVYLALNVLSLLVQLFLSTALVRRLGVGGAVVVTPLLILAGAGGALLTGGALLAVLLLKGADGTFRYSLHRLTSELLYLPLRRETRERVKPFIDGTAARAAQAVVGAGILGVAAAGVGGPGLAAIVVWLAASWFGVALSMRSYYLGTLRRTLTAGKLADADVDAGLDLAGAEILVEKLASREVAEVIGALRILASRKRARLISALVLYHPDPAVLVEALGIFGASGRDEWLPLAEPLLRHADAGVRHAALRAIAGHTAPQTLAELARDGSPRLRAYAAVHVALRESPDDVRHHPAVVAALRGEAECLRGVLAAIADLSPAAPLADLLVEIAAGDDAREEDELVARAAEQQRDARLIGPLVDRLGSRTARTAVQSALVALGEPAEEAVRAGLLDHGRGRQRRKHLPRALARFGTQRAADVLTQVLETDPDGMLRYEALRGLGRITADRDVRVDRRRVEALALANVVEHLRLGSLRVMLSGATDGGDAAAARRLLAGLLEDKAAQALERCFRLLKIAQRREDLHAAHYAARSGDLAARANAAEFLATLLARRDQQLLRELVALALDELDPVERAARAALLTGRAVPRSFPEALLALMDDGDATVASLAAHYGGKLDDAGLTTAARATYERRPALAERARSLVAPAMQGAPSP